MKSFIAAVGERLRWRQRPGNESGLGAGGLVPGSPNGDGVPPGRPNGDGVAPGRPKGDGEVPGSPNGDGEPAPPKGIVPLEIAVMNAGHCDWIA
jgi:hypothetical protein